MIDDVAPGPPAALRATMATAPCIRLRPSSQCTVELRKHPECVLAALAAENYAVVKVPEGVAVAHGARLVGTGYAASVFRVEATPGLIAQDSKGEVVIDASLPGPVSTSSNERAITRNQR